MYFVDKNMEKSRVVVIRGRRVFTQDGEIDAARVAAMLELGIRYMTGTDRAPDGLVRLFSRQDRIGIKVNTIGGRSISTRPGLALALAGLLSSSVVAERNIVIWDRTNRELREAGFLLSESSSGLKVFATDTAGAGYGTEPVSHLNIGSLFSTIQTNFATASISLAILKDHGLAGVTAGMKNYFGAIHNPNKYHDNHCDPFIAELFDTPVIRQKHRLSLLDALVVQYHRGPSYHSRWAEPWGRLIFSQDPVAADAVGWRYLEKLRERRGLPTLAEENRRPGYLETAEKMGLGRFAAGDIQITEDEV